VVLKLGGGPSGAEIPLLPNNLNTSFPRRRSTPRELLRSLRYRFIKSNLDAAHRNRLVEK
jgi:hypothetical protein